MRYRPFVEELEARLALSTIAAVRSGLWSDPGTWSGGVVPGVNDQVTIGNGISVRGNSPWAALRAQTPAGGTGLTFNGSVPSSWHTGDQLIVSGTDDKNTAEYETVTIAAISGSAVTLVAGLTYSHAAGAYVVDIAPGNAVANMITLNQNTGGAGTGRITGACAYLCGFWEYGAGGISSSLSIGDAFYYYSPNITAVSDVACDSNDYGFYLDGHATQHKQQGTLDSFTGNTAYSVTTGLYCRTVTGTVDHYTVAAAHTGMLEAYSLNVTVQYSRFLGGGPGSQSGIACQEGSEGATNSVYRNDTITGWITGVYISPLDAHTVRDCTFGRNTQDVFISIAHGTDRNVTVVGQAHIQFADNLYEELDARGLEVIFHDGGRVTLNGTQLYAPWQAWNYVPFPTLDTNLPPALAGLTNQELWHTYGLAMQLELAGQSPQRQPQLVSPTQAPHGVYLLQYRPPLAPRNSTPITQQITLAIGWNVVTVTIGKQQYCFFIWGE
jgi:hypothetical protein